MSKADDMFEKLGYEKGSGHNLGNGEKYIYYSGNYNNINLYKKSKKININGSFSMQELQAINEKVKELRLGKQLNKEIKSIKEK